MKTGNRPPPETCPNCGEDIPRHALACPGCGSDYQTGWSEESHYDGVGLPDEEFDYDAFAEREFGAGPKPRGMKWGRWLLGLLLLALAVYSFVLIFR